MTAAAPSGVVTFLFTDIEGSTRRWEADAESMRAALIAHDEVLRTAIEAHGGFLFSHTGDGVVAAIAFAQRQPRLAAAFDELRRGGWTSKSEGAIWLAWDKRSNIRFQANGSPFLKRRERRAVTASRSVSKWHPAAPWGGPCPPSGTGRI